MIWLKRLLLISILLIVCALIFGLCLRNDALVDIDLLFVQLPQVKIEFALVASFIIGGLAGLLSSLPLFYRQRKKYRDALHKVSLEK